MQAALPVDDEHDLIGRLVDIVRARYSIPELVLAPAFAGRARGSQSRIGTARRHLSAKVRECATVAARKGAARGRTMTGLLNDILLFSCIGAFVTGIVLAAASVLS